MSFAKLDKDGLGYFESIEEYCKCLNKLWKEIDVRRHLLCPLFATRFVSAFFFRARGSAAARRDGGLKEGGAVYAVSAPGLAADQASGSVSAVRFRKPWRGGGLGPPRRMAPPYVNLVFNCAASPP